ncbi:MAG: hypothetical protein KBD14_01575 [Candidatus Pacebacteria bacterium]|nr:hypothetical protein [Candidatus Paceibacterota bacterium]
MEFKIYDMDDNILLSPRVYESWSSYCPVAVAEIIKEANEKNIFLKKEDFSFEQFKVYENGIGEIFVEIKKLNKTISMKVPKNEYSLKK